MATFVVSSLRVRSSVLHIDPLILRNRKLRDGLFCFGRDSDLKVHSSDENVLCVGPGVSPVGELGKQEGRAGPRPGVASAVSRTIQALALHTQAGPTQGLPPG